MDTRYTAEQAELQRAARQLAGQLGVKTVADLDDVTRRNRLASAVRDAGWLELRDGAGDGSAVASGVEATIVAEALGAAAADAALTGPLLAHDLARRAGVTGAEGVPVAFASDLVSVAVVEGSETSVPVVVVDGDGTDAYLLVPAPGGFGLATVATTAGSATSGADLTRRVCTVPPGAPVTAIGGAATISGESLTAWRALGLALTSADLVGAMRGVLAVTVEYATERRQYGVPVGSFQAVQHLLAEAHCLMEGSHSVALHAAWAADALPPAEAEEAGRVAKAYCSRAARTVCETAVQVHGGIGNTWECIVHVYLRRALLSAQWFGDDAVQLRALADERLGAGSDGLP
jgi:alkylation response protein AidB-like acyl-CoA dehydrogenase